MRDDELGHGIGVGHCHRWAAIRSVIRRLFRDTASLPVFMERPPTETAGSLRDTGRLGGSDLHAVNVI
jgi:hypothetical protein